MSYIIERMGRVWRLLRLDGKHRYLLAVTSTKREALQLMRTMKWGGV